MEIIKIIILGVIEGITEFLPISSTAHLVASEKMLSFKDDAEIFTVVIQLGAILAALWFFRNDLRKLASGIAQGKRASRTFLMNVFIGLLPAGIVGLVIEMTVGLPKSFTLIGLSLIIGGIIIWLVENTIKPSTGNIDYNSITWQKALAIGVSQCLAIIPGVSRSGATIVSGLLSGLNRPTATAFSFYLSVPIMIAASGLKLAKDFDKVDTISGGWTALLLGSVVSFITAFIIVGWLLRYVQKHDFKPFAYYRILAGVLLLIIV